MYLKIKDPSELTELRMFRPHIALENIPVYKVLRYRSGSKSYETPFRHLTVEIKHNGCFENIKSDIGAKVNIIFKNGEQELQDIITYSGIHSYSDLYRAENACRLLINCYIFKAYIPKGSRYFLGTKGDVVSDELAIRKKRINPEKERCEMSKKSSM